MEEGCPAAMVKIHLRANDDACSCDFTAHSFDDNRQQALPEIWETMSAQPHLALPSARGRLSPEAL